MVNRFYNPQERAEMEKFNELVQFYSDVKTMMSVICVQKGGIDIDNYSGRFFAADLLEFIVAYGQKLKADVSEFEKELKSKTDLLTPSNKAIQEMSLAEFKKVFGITNV